jgi:hypothetical protein
MMKYYRLALAAASISMSQIEASCFMSSFGPHAFFLGPEVCYIKRVREGGSEQSGNLVGGHFRYDRISPCSVYWGFDGYYDTGHVSGKTASGREIKSTIDEYELQARLGYSLYAPERRKLLIIPYACYSYFYGSNKFDHPSPVQYRLHDHLHSGGGGIWVSFSLIDCLRCGVDFSARYIIKGYNRVTNDPEHDNVKLEVESKWQYQVEVPIEYAMAICDYRFEMRIVPFYRFRHLGGKPNYPFDYIETRFHESGAQLMLFLGF